MKAIKKIKEKIVSTGKNLEIKNKGYDIIALDKIKKGQPFVDLFPIKTETLKSISEDMKVNGYDVSQPVIIWKETNVLLDGYTRCAAAEKAGLTEVAYVVESFPDVDTALRYAYNLQFNRRNLSDSDRLSFSETYMDKVGPGAKKSGRKKTELAEILSVSTGTAQKYITVILRGSDRIKDSVKAGNLTINGAYKSILNKEKADFSKSTKSPQKSNKIKSNKGVKSNKTTNELVQIDLKLLEEKIDSWVYKIGVKEGNCHPYKERLLAVYEILPDNSYLKQYTQKLVNGGDQNECV